jgi:hypothetical protein
MVALFCETVDVEKQLRCRAAAAEERRKLRRFTKGSKSIDWSIAE